MRRSPSRPASTSTNPGPPSDCGASVSCRRAGLCAQPSAIASAACTAVRLSPKQSGATSTRRPIRSAVIPSRLLLAGVNLLGRKKDNPPPDDADDAEATRGQRFRRQAGLEPRHPRAGRRPSATQASVEAGPVAPAPMTTAEARRAAKRSRGPKLQPRGAQARTRWPGAPR